MMNFWSITVTIWGLVAIGLMVADAIAVFRQGSSAFLGVHDEGINRALDILSRSILWPVTMPTALFRRRSARPVKLTRGAPVK